MTKYQKFSLNPLLGCLFGWVFLVTAADHAVSMSHSGEWTDLIFWGGYFPHEYIGQEEKIGSFLLL